MKPCAISAGRAPTRCRICAAAARNSKLSCCAMATAIPARARGPRRTCATCASWLARPPASLFPSASSVLPHPAQRVVLEDAIAAIGSAEERIARLEEQMTALLESWPMKPVVRALMGMRGFAQVGAMVLTSELGGAWRFDHPRQLMAYLGLVPTENTSDEKRRQGGITKTGNSHARWLLIEAAHHYRLSPKVSKELSVRQQGLSPEIKACAWKAQTRLHQRMMALQARGKQRNKVTVAVARELTGFVWQIFQLMAPRMTQTQGASVKEGSRFGGN